jgi:hypothetical protein
MFSRQSTSIFHVESGPMDTIAYEQTAHEEDPHIFPRFQDLFNPILAVEDHPISSKQDEPGSLSSNMEQLGNDLLDNLIFGFYLPSLLIKSHQCVVWTPRHSGHVFCGLPLSWYQYLPHVLSTAAFCPPI